MSELISVLLSVFSLESLLTVLWALTMTALIVFIGIIVVALCLVITLWFDKRKKGMG